MRLFVRNTTNAKLSTDLHETWRFDSLVEYRERSSEEFFFGGGRLSRNCNELQWDAVDRPVDDGKDSSIKVSIEIVKLQI